MRKKIFFIKGAHKWNSMVYKFYKLYKRLRLLRANRDYSEEEYGRLSQKINILYKRLEKMQYRVGVRIAATTLALMLAVSVGNAQDFTVQGKLQGISADIDVSYNSDPVYADLDGDGDADMFVGNTYGNIAFYSNDGTGIFTFQNNLQADGSDIDVGNNAAPKFADLDGDGDLDLYAGDSNGKISIFTNGGTGTFSSAGYLQADAADIDVSTNAKFMFADLDGDTDLDLFIGDYYNGGSPGTKYDYIKYYKNDGNGVFTANGNLQADGSDIHIGGSGDVHISPAFADLDKDGDLDLYISSDNAPISVYSNDGTGTFSAAGNLQADGIDISSKFSYSAITFADINGDGSSDLFIGGQEGKIEYYKNNGTGNLSYESDVQELKTGDIANRYVAPEFADINGNGKLDLYMGTLRNSLLYFPNQGNMLFGFHSNVKDADKSIITDYTSSLTFADIDKDGDLDLYVADENGYINIYNNNAGEFTLQGKLQADGTDLSFSNPISPVFADFDNDGDMDLFVGEHSGLISYYINGGTGTFSAAGNLQADGADIDVGNSSAPVFADIDDDGDLDLFVGNNYGNINYYTNNGSGVLSSQGLLQANSTDINVTSYSDPTFADLDGDGDLDLFVGSDLGNVFYYKNLSLISNAGEDAEVLCSLQYTLNANEPDAGKTGTWSIQSGGTGNFDDVNAYNAVFTADSESAYTLRWSVSDGSNTVFDDVLITFTPDQENPTITCVGNETVDADSNHEYIVNGSEFDPTETGDNCNVASVVNDFNNSNTLAGESLTEGTVTVQWTVTDDAGNTQVCSFDIQVNAFVGIENISKNKISIFPNPVNDLLSISLGNFSNQKNVKMKITDILGKTVFEKEAVKNSEVVNVSSLKKGIYLMNIISNSMVSTVKFIKD